MVGTWVAMSCDTRLCGRDIPLRYACTVDAADCSDTAVRRGVTRARAHRRCARSVLRAGVDGVGGLVLLATLAVARGRRALLQHGRKQVCRVGCAALALVLLQCSHTGMSHLLLLIHY